MSRRLTKLHAAAVVIAGLLAGCGGSPAAVIRTAPSESADEVEDVTAPAVGADLDPAAGLVGVNSDELSELPGLGAPLDQASGEAVAAAEALLEGFVNAMAVNNFDRAATLTTGEAKAFLFHLAEAGRCGFSLVGAELSSVSPAAELAGVGQLAIPVSASFTLDTGLTRNLSAVGVRREAEGVWLISDFLIDGSTADEMSVDLDSTVRADLRLTPTEQCAGPSVVEATFEVLNEGRDPIVLKELYFLDSRGNRYPVSGTDPVAGGPIPGRNADPLIWEWTVEVENGYDGGQFVLVAADLDESRQENTEVLIAREYPISPSPFFSDIDVDAAAIAKALGGVVTTTTAVESGGGDPNGSPPSSLPSTASTGTTPTTATTATSASTDTTPIQTASTTSSSSP